MLNVKSNFFFEIFDTSIFVLKFSDKKFVITGKPKKDKITIMLANENLDKLFKYLLRKTLLFFFADLSFLNLNEFGFTNIASFRVFLSHNLILKIKYIKLEMSFKQIKLLLPQEYSEIINFGHLVLTSWLKMDIQNSYLVARL